MMEEPINQNRQAVTPEAAAVSDQQSSTDTLPGQVTETTLLQLKEKNEHLARLQLLTPLVQHKTTMKAVPFNFSKSVKGKDLKDIKAVQEKATTWHTPIRCACRVHPLPVRPEKQTVAKSADTSVDTNGKTEEEPVEEQPEPVPVGTAEPVVWCAEQDGSITIRNCTNGIVIYTIREPKNGCHPTAMIHVPHKGKFTVFNEYAGRYKECRKMRFEHDFVWVGFNDGTIRLFPASTDAYKSSESSVKTDEDCFLVFEVQKLHAAQIQCFACSSDAYSNVSLSYQDFSSEGWLQDNAPVLDADELTTRMQWERRAHRADDLFTKTEFMLCAGSTDSIVSVWDVPRVYEKIAELQVEQKLHLLEYKKSVSGLKGALLGKSATEIAMAGGRSASVQSSGFSGDPKPAPKTKPVFIRGDPIYFESQAQIFRDETGKELEIKPSSERATCFCGIIPIRPMIKLKGFVSGVKTLVWETTIVLPCHADQIPGKKHAKPVEEDPFDDATEEEKLLARIQTKTRQEIRNEERERLQMTEAEYKQAVAEARKKDGAPEEAERYPLSECMPKRVDLIFSGDDEGHLCFWNLEEELKRNPLVALEGIQTQLIPSGSPLSDGSQSRRRPFHPGGQAREPSHSATSLAGNKEHLTPCHNSENKITFTGGVAITGIAVCLPKITYVATVDGKPTFQQDAEVNTEPQSSQRDTPSGPKGGAYSPPPQQSPGYSKSGPVDITSEQALFAAYKNLKIFVTLSDGALFAILCSPMMPQDEMKSNPVAEDANTVDPAGKFPKVVHARIVPYPTASLFNPDRFDGQVQGSFTYPTFTVNFNIDQLDARNQYSLGLLHDRHNNTIWVMGNDKSIYIWDSESLAVVGQIENPYYNFTSRPPSSGDANERMEQYRSGSAQGRKSSGVSPAPGKARQTKQGQTTPAKTQGTKGLAKPGQGKQSDAPDTTEKPLQITMEDAEFYYDTENPAFFQAIVPMLMERFPRLLTMRKEADDKFTVQISCTAPKKILQPILETQYMEADRLRDNVSGQGQRTAAKKAEKANCRKWEEIVQIKCDKLDHLQQFIKYNRKQMYHIYFMRWQAFVRKMLNKRTKENDQRVFAQHAHFDALVTQELHETVLEMARVWKEQKQLTASHCQLNVTSHRMLFERYHDLKAWAPVHRYKKKVLPKMANVLAVRNTLEPMVVFWHKWAYEKGEARRHESRRQTMGRLMQHLFETHIRVDCYKRWYIFMRYTQRMRRLRKLQDNFCPLLERTRRHYYFWRWTQNARICAETRRKAHHFGHIDRLESEEWKLKVKCENVQPRHPGFDSEKNETLDNMEPTWEVEQELEKLKVLAAGFGVLFTEPLTSDDCKLVTKSDDAADPTSMLKLQLDQLETVLKALQDDVADTSKKLAEKIQENSDCQFAIEYFEGERYRLSHPTAISALQTYIGRLRYLLVSAGTCTIEKQEAAQDAEGESQPPTQKFTENPMEKDLYAPYNGNILSGEDAQKQLLNAVNALKDYLGSQSFEDIETELRAAMEKLQEGVWADAEAWAMKDHARVVVIEEDRAAKIRWLEELKRVEVLNETRQRAKADRETEREYRQKAKQERANVRTHKKRALVKAVKLEQMEEANKVANEECSERTKVEDEVVSIRCSAEDESQKLVEEADWKAQESALNTKREDIEKQAAEDYQQQLDGFQQRDTQIQTDGQKLEEKAKDLEQEKGKLDDEAQQIVDQKKAEAEKFDAENQELEKQDQELNEKRQKNSEADSAFQTQHAQDKTALGDEEDKLNEERTVIEANHTDVLGDLETQEKKLKEEQDEKSEDLKKKRSDLVEARQKEDAEVSTELQQIQDQVDQVNATASDEEKDAQQAVDAAKVKVTQLEQEFDAAEKRYKDAQVFDKEHEDVKKAKDKRDQAEQDVDAAKVKVTQLEQEFDAAEQSYKDVRTAEEFDDENEGVKTAKDKRDQAEQAVDAAKANVTQLEQEFDAAEKSYKDVQPFDKEDVKKAKDKRDQAEQDVDAAKVKVTQLEQEFDDAEQSHKDVRTAEEFDDEHEDVKTAKDKRDQAEQAVDAAKVKVTQLEQEFDDAKKSYKDVQACDDEHEDVETAKGKRDQAEQAVDAAKAEVTELEAKLTEATENSKKANSDALEDLKTKKDAVEQRTQKLEDDRKAEDVQLDKDAENISLEFSAKIKDCQTKKDEEDEKFKQAIEAHEKKEKEVNEKKEKHAQEGLAHEEEMKKVKEEEDAAVEKIAEGMKSSEERHVEEEKRIADAEVALKGKEEDFEKQKDALEVEKKELEGVKVQLQADRDQTNKTYEEKKVTITTECDAEFADAKTSFDTKVENRVAEWKGKREKEEAQRTSDRKADVASINSAYTEESETLKSTREVALEDAEITELTSPHNAQQDDVDTDNEAEPQPDPALTYKPAEIPDAEGLPALPLEVDVNEAEKQWLPPIPSAGCAYLPVSPASLWSLNDAEMTSVGQFSLVNYQRWGNKVFGFSSKRWADLTEEEVKTTQEDVDAATNKVTQLEQELDAAEQSYKEVRAAEEFDDENEGVKAAKDKRDQAEQAVNAAKTAVPVLKSSKFPTELQARMSHVLFALDNYEAQLFDKATYTKEEEDGLQQLSASEGGSTQEEGEQVANTSMTHSPQQKQFTDEFSEKHNQPIPSQEGVDAAKVKVTQLQQKLDAAEQSYKDVRACDDEHEDVKAAKGKRDQAEQAVDVAKGEVTQLEQEFDAAEQSYKDVRAAEESNDEQEDVKTAKDKRDQAEQAVDAAKVKVTQLEQEFDAAEQSYKDVRAAHPRDDEHEDVKAAKAKRDQAEQAVNAAKAEVTELEAQLAKPPLTEEEKFGLSKEEQEYANQGTFLELLDNLNTLTSMLQWNSAFYCLDGTLVVPDKPKVPGVATEEEKREEDAVPTEEEKKEEEPVEGDEKKDDEVKATSTNNVNEAGPSPTQTEAATVEQNKSQEELSKAQATQENTEQTESGEKREEDAVPTEEEKKEEEPAESKDAEETTETKETAEPQVVEGEQGRKKTRKGKK